MGIPINSVSAEVKAPCDLRGLVGLADDAVALSSVDATITIDSPADEAQLQQLKGAVDAHCPLVATLQNSIPVALTMSRKSAA